MGAGPPSEADGAAASAAAGALERRAACSGSDRWKSLVGRFRHAERPGRHGGSR